MTVYVFTNNAEGSLNSAIGSTDVTLTMESGEGAEFPSPTTGEGFFILVSQGASSEWMLCTTRSSDVLTVTRAQSGSTAKSFSAGANVIHPLNATTLESFLQKGDYRTNDGSPDGSLAAEYTGEEVMDTTNGIWYKHTTGTTWKAMHS